MRVQWFGQSSFLLVSSEGTMVITDPYSPEGPEGSVRYAPIGISPDIVTISHSHLDHCGVEQFGEELQAISAPVTRTIRDVKISGIEWYHDPQMSIPNIIFLFGIDRMRLCHLGDTGCDPTPQLLERIGSVDILFIPVGGHHTIGPSEANALIARIRPRLVIPMHYLTPKIGFPLLPVDNFLQGQKNVIKLNATEIDITKEQLPEETHILVLRYAR